LRNSFLIIELRTAMLTHAIALGALLVTMFVVARVMVFRGLQAGDVGQAVDMLMVPLLILSGIASGARGFSPRFNSMRERFLDHLPIRSIEIWLIVFGVNVVSALAIIGAGIVLRPGVLETTLIPSIGLAVTFYLVLFSAGALYTQLFQKPLLAYVAGALISLMLLLLARTPLPLVVNPDVAVELILHTQTIPVGLLLFAVNTVLSATLFVRGDLLYRRTRIWNWLVVSSILLAITAGAAGGAFRAWVPRVTTENRFRASSDCRFVAVVERPVDLAAMQRLRIVETASRTVRATIESPPGSTFKWYRWTADDEYLEYIVHPSLGDGEAVFGRLAVGRWKRSEVGLGGSRVQRVERCGDHLFMDVWDEIETRIVRIDAGSMQPTTVLASRYFSGGSAVDGAGEPRLFSWGNERCFARLRTEQDRYATWLLEPEPRMLEEGGGPLIWGTLNIHGREYGVGAEARRALAELYPWPADTNAGDAPDLRGDGYIARWNIRMGVDPVFHLSGPGPDGTGALEVWDQQEQHWRTVAAGVIDSTAEFDDVRPVWISGVAFSGIGRFAVFRRRDDQGKLGLWFYDTDRSRLSRVQPVSMPADEPPEYFWMGSVPDSRNLIVVAEFGSIWGNTRGEIFEYDVDTGTVRSLAPAPSPSFWHDRSVVCVVESRVLQTVLTYGPSRYDHRAAWFDLKGESEPFWPLE